MSTRKQPRIAVTIVRVAGNWSRALPSFNKTIRVWCGAALAGMGAGKLSIVLADDAFLKELNHTYRGKNKPTNVLSFSGEQDELGDVVLALETIKKEAKEQGKRFKDHVAHLVVHGCLHLLGHDHEHEHERVRMETKEKKILAIFGINDPYEVA